MASNTALASCLWGVNLKRLFETGNNGAMINNSTTLIYYAALVNSCLAIVAPVILAALPVHATDAAEIKQIHLVDGLNTVTLFVGHCVSRSEM